MKNEQEFKANEIISLLNPNRRIVFVIKKKFKDEKHSLNEWKKILKIDSN